MYILIEQTVNYMGTLNPKYTQSLLEEANNSDNVVMMLGKDGKPSGAYVRVSDIDMKKFRKKKDNIE